MTTGGRTDSSTSTTAHPKSNDDRGRTASPHAVASIHTPAPKMQLMTVFLAIFSNSVSIHTPAWGATRQISQTSQTLVTFQFTHPHGVRPASINSENSIAAFQFTHPHGGATAPGGQFDCSGQVSIHAPAWGCDPATAAGVVVFGRFNSRTRMGVRLPFGGQVVGVVFVSIHAPAWGCDRRSTAAMIGSHGFNSRTRMGVRLSARLTLWQWLLFQFTHPHGGATFLDFGNNQPCTRFNSRTRMGVRHTA